MSDTAVVKDNSATQRWTVQDPAGGTVQKVPVTWSNTGGKWVLAAAPVVPAA